MSNQQFGLVLEEYLLPELCALVLMYDLNVQGQILGKESRVVRQFCTLVTGRVVMNEKEVEKVWFQAHVCFKASNALDFYYACLRCNLVGWFSHDGFIRLGRGWSILFTSWNASDLKATLDALFWHLDTTPENDLISALTEITGPPGTNVARPVTGSIMVVANRLTSAKHAQISRFVIKHAVPFAFEWIILLGSLDVVNELIEKEQKIDYDLVANEFFFYFPDLSEERRLLVWKLLIRGPRIVPENEWPFVWKRWTCLARLDPKLASEWKARFMLICPTYSFEDFGIDHVLNLSLCDADDKAIFPFILSAWEAQCAKISEMDKIKICDKVMWASRELTAEKFPGLVRCVQHHPVFRNVDRLIRVLKFRNAPLLSLALKLAAKFNPEDSEKLKTGIQNVLLESSSNNAHDSELGAIWSAFTLI